MSAHELKPVDFDFPNGQIQRLHGENRYPDQYFVVCVNQVTEDDVQLYREAREKYGRMVHLVRQPLFHILGKNTSCFILYYNTFNYSPI